MSDRLGRLQQAINDMADEVEDGPAVYRPSEFWTHLGKVHGAQLSAGGIESFKRTVNQSYYNWLLGLRDPQVLSLVRWSLRHPRPAVLGARLEDWAGFESQARRNPFEDRRRRWLYQAAVACLWEYAHARDSLGLLDRLQEPALGKPVTVRHRGRAISQDLANSVIEFYAISEAIGGNHPGGNGVVELGAGYGRLAWVYLSAFRGLRYVVVDIPPALAIAQEYLTNLLPDRPAFRFRRFAAYEDVEAEWHDAELAFLTPNQLAQMPPLRAGAFVNISSLHEMRPDQIQEYLTLVDRHTAGTFYMKQWRKWTNPADQVTLTQADYPVPSHWIKRYERPHPIQTAFFEAAYSVNEVD